VYIRPPTRCSAKRLSNKRQSLVKMPACMPNNSCYLRRESPRGPSVITIKPPPNGPKGLLDIELHSALASEANTVGCQSASAPPRSNNFSAPLLLFRARRPSGRCAPLSILGRHQSLCQRVPTLSALTFESNSSTKFVAVALNVDALHEMARLSRRMQNPTPGDTRPRAYGRSQRYGTMLPALPPHSRG